MILNFLAPLILLSIALFHLLIFSQFSLTWDFPHHLLIGMIQLKMVPLPTELYSKPYGIMTDVVPVLFANLLPSSWIPFSYLLFSVIIGSVGILFFYFLLKDYFDTRIALLSSLVLFFLPRFIGHLHTNIKDINNASFIIISVYFFHLFCTRKKFIFSLLSIFTFTLAVNTKLTALQFLPIFITWSIYNLLQFKGKPHKLYEYSIDYFFLNLGLILIPILSWIILWPHWLISISSTVRDFIAVFNLLPPKPFYYSIEQLIITTPLQILVFVPFGLWVLWKKVKHENHALSLVLLILLFYSLLKYPFLRFPLLDDIRYFIEIYYPLSLSFVLGVDFLAGKFSTYVIVAVILSCVYLNYLHHPYQINYYNFLAVNKDADFWAASYKEVFQYLNKKVPEGSIVSVRLAPELAYYLIRSDLREKLNTRNPEESDYVVILNRPSFFGLFQVDKFVATHKPFKVFTDRTGMIMSYLYKL